MTNPAKFNLGLWVEIVNIVQTQTLELRDKQIVFQNKSYHQKEKLLKKNNNLNLIEKIYGSQGLWAGKLDKILEILLR